MSDRKVFAEILETLHRGRDKPAEQRAPKGTAAGAQVKGGPKCAPKCAKAGSRSKTSKAVAKERGEPSSAAVNKPGKSLDCGDLEQRYGKLNLTSVRPADHTRPAGPSGSTAAPQLGSESCSPMQIQARREALLACSSAYTSCQQPTDRGPTLKMPCSLWQY